MNKRPPKLRQKFRRQGQDRMEDTEKVKTWHEQWQRSRIVYSHWENTVYHVIRVEDM